MTLAARKIKFKAWNTETKLLMRLNSIECNKGELIKKDHLLLQFTGLHDKEEEEIYDQDVFLLSLEKFLVYWSDQQSGWYYRSLEQKGEPQPFRTDVAQRAKRFCSYLELTKT